MFKKSKYIIIALFIALTALSVVFIPFVTINYNPIEYLPKDSKTIEAMEQMEKEFGLQGSVNIMFDNITDTNEIKVLYDRLLEMDNIDNVQFQIANDAVLFNVVLSSDDYSKASQGTIKTIIDTFEKHDYTFYMNGQAYLTYRYNIMMNEQIPTIILYLVPIVLLILILMTKSYFEPVLFLIIVGISILINLGTNVLLPNVSYMTYSIAAILQFALCMDYSIILLHRYQDVRKEEPDPYKAIVIAWKSSLIPILASSLTTVAGFVAIMFMKYRIGLDIGLVLSKGVVITLITVLLLLPCLIILCENFIVKTQHRTILEVFQDRRHQRVAKAKPSIKEKGLAAFLYRTRKQLPIVASVVVIIGFVLQLNNTFTYSDNTTTNDIPIIKESNAKIEESFGLVNQAIILVKADDNISGFITDLEEILVKDVMYHPTTISYDTQMDAQLLARLFQDKDIAIDDLQGLIHMLSNQMEKSTISLRELVDKIAIMKTKMTVAELYTFVNPLFHTSLQDLQMIYSLIGKDTVSLFDIVTYLKTPQNEVTMKANFPMIHPDQIERIYDVLGVETLDVASLLIIYHSNLISQMDVAILAEVLKPYLTLEKLTAISNLLQTNFFSVEEMVNYFTKPFNQTEMKAILASMDPNAIDAIFAQLEAGGYTSNNTVTLKVFVSYVLQNMNESITQAERATLNALLANVLLIESYQPLLATLNSMHPLLTVVVNLRPEILFLMQSDTSFITKQFVGEKYQRIIVTTSLPEESKASFAFYEKLEEIVDQKYEDHYILSTTSSVMDIKVAAQMDYLLTSLISIAMVFIIIMISFRSITIPIILVLLIEGAIFINMATPALLHQPILYMGYVIVSCIQLGATIDYGILITHRYLENRTMYDQKTSMVNTFRESTGPILTSGLILTISGLLLGVISNIPVIALLGRMLGFGGLISMTLVLFILPQLLCVFDRYVIYKKKEKTM